MFMWHQLSVRPELSFLHWDSLVVLLTNSRRTLEMSVFGGWKVFSTTQQPWDNLEILLACFTQKAITSVQRFCHSCCSPVSIELVVLDLRTGWDLSWTELVLGYFICDNSAVLIIYPRLAPLCGKAVTNPKLFAQQTAALFVYRTWESCWGFSWESMKREQTMKWKCVKIDLSRPKTKEEEILTISIVLLFVEDSGWWQIVITSSRAPLRNQRVTESVNLAPENRHW